MGATDSRAFDQVKADAFLDGLRSGDGWTSALNRADINELTVAVWLRRATTPGADGAPYRSFLVGMQEVVRNALAAKKRLLRSPK